MINLSQWKANVVRPSLALLAPIPDIGAKLAAEWAVNQVTGTTKESGGCEYVRQYPTGPAWGFYQMEEATHDDIWENYLRYNQALGAVIYGSVSNTKSNLATAAQPIYAPIVAMMKGEYQLLITNLTYATLMCRIDYYRSKLAAPANTAQALAQYHKTVYNTAGGASVAADDVSYYAQAIAA